MLGEWGIPKDSPAGRQRLERALEERLLAEEGEEKFREELLTQMSERMGRSITARSAPRRRRCWRN